MKVAAITGGASGIGEACARHFAAQGHHVWLLDRDQGRADEVAQSIEADGGRATARRADVTDEQALNAVADEIEGNAGAAEILVTSAGILEHSATILDADMALHDRVWSVNYRGTVLACRAFGRQMRRARRGAIVTVGSINSFAALPVPAYCPSKTALVRLTELLSVELGRFGVRANGVAPTYVLTPAMQARIDAGQRDPDALSKSGAIEMFVRPEHVASVVGFLCSDAAAAVTGVMLPVDTGWRAAIPYRSFAGGLPWDERDEAR